MGGREDQLKGYIRTIKKRCATQTHSKTDLDGVLVEIVLQHLLHYFGRHLGVLLLRDAAGGDLHRALAVLAEALDAVVGHTRRRHAHALQEIKVMKKKSNDQFTVHRNKND